MGTATLARDVAEARRTIEEASRVIAQAREAGFESHPTELPLFDGHFTIASFTAKDGVPASVSISHSGYTWKANSSGEVLGVIEALRTAADRAFRRT